MDSADSGAPFLSAVEVLASAYIAAAQSGAESSGPDYSDVILAARAAGQLQHPLVLLASNWKAWLHPRGKDGRFIETFALVNIFANPEDSLSDHSAPRMRARITKLTEEHAEVRYFNPSGEEVPADPDKGFPELIPANQIRTKVSLAPHAIARLDGKRDRNMWFAISAQFNADLREDPPAGKSYNMAGADLTEDSPEWADHQKYVNDVLGRAADAGITSGEYLMDKDENWTKETLDYFESVVNEELEKVRKRGVPQESRAVILGGVPGSGKSTTAEDREGAFAAAKLGDMNEWVVVNPDDFKKLLIERGEIPKIDGLSPMETAPLFHSLSSEMSHMFGRALMAEGYNVVLDITMRGKPDEKTGKVPVEEEVEMLTGLNYSVDSVFVDLPVEVALKRQKARHLEGLNALRRGDSPIGGRVVPPGVTRMRLRDQSESSVNFWNLVEKGMLGRWAVVDTSDTSRVAEAGVGTVKHEDPVAALKDPANIPGVKP